MRVHFITLNVAYSLINNFKGYKDMGKKFYVEEVVVEVWGNFACFTQPICKVERFTYPVMTPSAARGLLSAIYCRPTLFYWQITEIEVLAPVKYITFKCNALKSSKIDLFKPAPVNAIEQRTQRVNTCLKDVRYRIHAKIVKNPDCKDPVALFYAQALQRIKNGSCFRQPVLGCREFVCYFSPPTDTQPIAEDKDLGLMLYDMFDLDAWDKTEKYEPEKTFITYFKADMRNGVIRVPAYNSTDVIKPIS